LIVIDNKVGSVIANPLFKGDIGELRYPGRHFHAVSAVYPILDVNQHGRVRVDEVAIPAGQEDAPVVGNDLLCHSMDG